VTDETCDEQPTAPTEAEELDAETIEAMRRDAARYEYLREHWPRLVTMNGLGRRDSVRDEHPGAGIADITSIRSRWIRPSTPRWTEKRDRTAT
jgi:hypothetical protein